MPSRLKALVKKENCKRAREYSAGACEVARVHPQWEVRTAHPASTSLHFEPRENFGTSHLSLFMAAHHGAERRAAAAPQDDLD